MGLTILYSPTDAAGSASSPSAATTTPVEPTVDIVLVHGLNGDATKSWTNEKSKAFWPKDFLPQDTPDARVLTYGYNAVAAFGNTTATIEDHAKGLLSSLIDKRDDEKRPIIFIAHSLGGIIVKQALFSARIETQYIPIFEHTAGIIFLGTPHRGSDKVTYGKILSDVASTVIRKPSSALLSALDTNSPILAQLTTNFRHQLPQYQIISFYELKSFGIFKDPVVVKQSALLDVADEDQIPVDASHGDICKFSGRDDETYEKLFNRIRRILKAKRNANHALINEHYLVPHYVSANFTGREEVCKLLQKNCLDPQIMTMQRRFVLHGLGGSGKTQVALKFAQDNREKFWAVFWIDCSTTQNIEQSFTDIGKACKIEGGVKSVSNWFSNTREQWLLIYDNADDIFLDLLPFFPTGSRGTIVISTRNPQCKHHQTVGSYEFGEMGAGEAMELLLKASGNDLTSPECREAATEIVATLGNLALAIVQAGAFIAQGMCRIDEYCAIYHRHRKSLLTRGPTQGSTDYKYTVYTTWEVSVSMIEQMDTHSSNHAMDLLRLFSGFHFDGISEEIFERAWKGTMKYFKWYSESEWNVSHSLNWLYAESSDDWDPFHLHDPIDILLSFSLIKCDTFRSIRNYSMHPLVHSWSRDRLSSEEQKTWSLTSAETLSFSIPYEDSASDHQFRRSVLSHVSAGLRIIADETLFERGSGQQERLQIVASFVKVLIDNGQTKDEIRLGQKLVEARADLLGEEHNKTLVSMSMLALCYSAIGRLREAMNLNKQVLEILTHTLGEDRQETLALMNNLALNYSALGQYQDALELNEKAFETRKRVLGEEHPNTLNSMNSLASSYDELGRFQDATKLNEKVLEVSGRVLGEEHPDTLINKGNLANCYSKLGQHQDASQLHEKVLEIRKRILGEKHPGTLSSMNNLAVNFSDIGRLSEAVSLLEETVKLRTEVLGKEHPNTVASECQLARIYGKSGRLDEAIALYERTLEVGTRVLGEGHPDIIRSKYELGCCFGKSGRINEAIHIIKIIIELGKRELGEEHPDTLKSSYELARCLSKSGRINEAVQIFKRVIELEKRVLGEEHPDTLISIKELKFWRGKLEQDSQLPGVIPVEAESDSESSYQDNRSGQQSQQADMIAPHQVDTSAHEPVLPMQQEKRKSRVFKALVQRIRR